MTLTQQQGDVLHYHGPNGGDIEVMDGFTIMTQYLEVLIYYCLFGGNADDDGSAATEKKQWWGNEGEPEERKLRGRFQSMLNGSPITSGRIVELEDAATEDITTGAKGYISGVTVSISAPTPKRIDMVVNVTAMEETVYTYQYDGIAA